MGLLEHSIDNSVRNSRAALLLLLGEAGVGKSRLAEELAEKTSCDRHALVLEGRCVPYGEANVWWPIADALRHGAGIRSNDPPERAIELARSSVLASLGEDAPAAEVDEVLQGLLYLMGYPSALQGIDATRAREQAAASVVTYAERYSMIRPVVVVLSDLHWADDLVLALIDDLLDRLANRRFVVIATARAAIEDRWHPPHGRHNLVVLTLDALTAEASSTLLAELAGEELGDDLTRVLLDRSGGNPFFLEELVTLLADAGMVGADRIDAEARVELPDTLRGLVSARLDGLTTDERRVLEDCAVLGRRGPVSAIEVMSAKHLNIGDVRPYLESLQAKDLLVLTGAGAGERWTFRSDVVREVAYGTLTKADRIRSHQAIAAWMEDHEDTERDAIVDQITHHYTSAAELAHELGPVPGVFEDLPDRALTWVERAASRAEQAELHVVSERLYGEGLRLLRGTHGPRHRAFLTGRARALAGLRDLAPARADATAAVTEARQAGPDACAELADALLVLAEVEQKESSWSAAEAALDEASALFGRVGDPRGEAEVLRLRGFGALFRHEYDAATQLLEDALARFEDLGDLRGTAWAQQNLAWCAFYSGRAVEAEEQLRRAAATFEAIGDPGGLAWARGLMAWTRFQQGYVEEAGELAEAVLADELRGMGDRWARGMMLLLAGSVQLWSGRTGKAIERLEQAHSLFVEIDDPFGLIQSGAVLGRALVLSGQVAEGLEMAQAPHLPAQASPWDNLLGAMASLAATVQVGDVDQSEHILATAPVDVLGQLEAGIVSAPAGGEGMTEAIVGSTELATVLGLHRLQAGDVAGAVSLLEWFDGQLAAIDPNLHAATALAHCAAGDLDRAIREADEVDAQDRATYLDRLTAGVARGLALARRGDGAAATASFDQLRAAADATEDRVSQALARLAGATAASALGKADAADRMAEADARLAEIGLLGTAWRQAFSLGLGLSPAT